MEGSFDRTIVWKLKYVSYPRNDDFDNLPF